MIPLSPVFHVRQNAVHTADGPRLRAASIPLSLHVRFRRVSLLNSRGHFNSGWVLLTRAGRRAAWRVSALSRAPILHVEALDAIHVQKIRRNQDSLVCEGVSCDCNIEVFERGALGLE